MKKIFIVSILSIFGLIWANLSNAQMTHSLDTAGMAVGTTTINNLTFIYSGLVSNNLPANVRFDYVGGSGPVSSSAYSSTILYSISDTAGTIEISLSGLSSSTLYSINYVFNGFGSSYFMVVHPGSDIKITTLGPPKILTQPQGAVLDSGETVTLSVTLDQAGAPFTYLWREVKSGTIFGTASTLDYYVGGPSDSTTLEVEVSNAGGSVTSDKAKITVNRPFKIKDLEPILSQATTLLSFNYFSNDPEAKVRAKYSSDPSFVTNSSVTDWLKLGVTKNPQDIAIQLPNTKAGYVFLQFKHSGNNYTSESTDTITFGDVFPLGLEESKDAFQFKVYPTPVSVGNIVNFETEEKCKLFVYNIAGQEIYNQTLYPGQNKLRFYFPESVYVYQLVTETGQKVSGRLDLVH